MSLSAEQMLGLFSIMLAAALIPGVSVMAVVARTASGGFTHGLVTTVGIVCGDLLFILLAVFGLGLLASLLGQYFVIVKILAGAWLLWLGIILLRTRPTVSTGNDTSRHSLTSSFMLGLLITLGDQKAVLFYMGLLPALIDVTTLGMADIMVIMLLAIVALGSKLVYAVVIAHSRQRFASGHMLRMVNIIAACIMLLTALVLFWQSWQALIQTA